MHGCFLCTFLPFMCAGADETIRVEAAQVVDAGGNVVGLYGGMVPVANSQGETVTAIAVIVRTGYVLPLTTQGDVGLFRLAYFADEDCSGDEYLSPVADSRSSAPLAGLIYRSLATGQIRYVPQYLASDRREVKSRMYFDDRNVLKCEAEQAVADVLPTAGNDPAVTGYEPEPTEQRAVALRVPEMARRQGGGLGRLLENGGRLDNTPEGLADQECSPGCLWEETGNNVCDIGCYVEACYFDGGDCNNETAEYLEKELARMCSPGCFLDDLADSFCDRACNNSACEFDRGDCDQ